MDPRVTLGVLCDQILPSEAPTDEEELFMRDRLRSLVLSFLTGEAKRVIVEGHAMVGSTFETVLIQSLHSVSGSCIICLSVFTRQYRYSRN